MATVSTVKELVCLCREASVTLFIWGTHGLGKSSLARQVAEEKGIGFIDFRCAQIESSDLRGLPDKGADGRTHFLPPADFPRSGEGILFLDELNRAGRDVLSAAFQLVLDRAVGEYQLPEGWSIIAAGNFPQEEYAVTEMDPALLDRFAHVTLSSGQATFDEWVKWLSAEHGPAAQPVIDFCAENLKHLESPSLDEPPFKVLPSRRSWDRALRCLSAWEQGNYSKDARLEVLAGLVGRPLAIAFLKQWQTVIRPADLLRSGVNKVRKRIEALSRPQLQSLMWGVVEATRRQNEAKVSEILLDFAECLCGLGQRDLAFAFCTALLEHDPVASQGDSVMRSALLTNVTLGASLTQVHEANGESLGFYRRFLSRPMLTRAFASVYDECPTQNPPELTPCNMTN